MKIGVDIRVLMDEYYSGVSEYAANLLRALYRQDENNNYKLFYNSWHNLDTRLSQWNNERSQVIGRHWPNKIFNYLFQKTLNYPKLDKILGGVDVFWSPHFNFTRLSSSATGLKRIITVHDLSFLRYPEFFSLRKNLWHQALNVKKTLQEADKIIAISQNTKNDIMELVGIAPEKIAVIYSGVNLIKREVSAEERQEFLNKHQLSGRFILYLGNIEPRKNIEGTIAAFNDLRTKDAAGRHELSDLKLILAGATGWKNKKIYQAYQKSPYKNSIKFLGYISEKDKDILYSSASVFIYPSFYEGFGFPPLEAMVYGLPVVCSNTSSLPEVVGPAALMINPYQTEEIREALEMILRDDKIRTRLINEGYQRIKLFSWEKTATQYLQVFEEVYASQREKK